MDIFHVKAATIQWLSTGFMLINGVLVPITAFLRKRFTTKQLFISSMFFLLIGSVICACAINFGRLLTGRMIQAIGAGIIMPLMMTVILYLYPSEKRGSIMGTIGFAMIFAPAIAPTLSGFIIEYVSWNKRNSSRQSLIRRDSNHGILFDNFTSCEAGDKVCLIFIR